MFQQNTNLLPDEILFLNFFIGANMSLSKCHAISIRYYEPKVINFRFLFKHNQTLSSLNTPVVALQTPGLSSYPGALTSFGPQDFSIGSDIGLSAMSWSSHQIPTSLTHSSTCLPHLAVSSSTPPPTSSPLPIKIKSEPISPPREHHPHLSTTVHHTHVQTLNLTHR